MKIIFALSVLMIVCSTHAIVDVCPPMDFSGDCAVGLEDFAMFIEQWLDSEPNSPGIEWHFVWYAGATFYGDMAKYEVTNAQYCTYLNAALRSGDITVVGNAVRGAAGSNSGTDFVGQIYYNLGGEGCEAWDNHNGAGARINYNGTWFTVDGQYLDIAYRKYDAHPVSHVSWYGATAFCNYYGWRLPTEWEWEAVAGYNSNHTSGFVWCEGGDFEGTCAWYTFGANGFGYGMCHMLGNVSEWTSTVIAPDNRRMFRGGSWGDPFEVCTASYRDEVATTTAPDMTNCRIGFRPCR